MNIVLPVALCLVLGAGDEKKDDTKAAAKDLVGGSTDSSDGGVDVTKLPFTPDTIKQIVSAVQPQIQSCYEETLAAKNKAVEGKLKTSFTINPDGTVKNARVDRKSSLKDQKLNDCVVSVLSALLFPKPPGGKAQPIDFPFNLKAVR